MAIPQLSSLGSSSTTAAATTREHSPFLFFSLFFSSLLFFSVFLPLCLFLLRFFLLFFYSFIIPVATVGHVQPTRQEPTARCWDIAPFFDEPPSPGPSRFDFISFFLFFFFTFLSSLFPVFFSFHPYLYIYLYVHEIYSAMITRRHDGRRGPTSIPFLFIVFFFCFSSSTNPTGAGQSSSFPSCI